MRYLLTLWYDVEPEVTGPYATNEHVLHAARKVLGHGGHTSEHSVFSVVCHEGEAPIIEPFGHLELFPNDGDK